MFPVNPFEREKHRFNTLAEADEIVARSYPDFVGKEGSVGSWHWWQYDSQGGREIIAKAWLPSRAKRWFLTIK